VPSPVQSSTGYIQTLNSAGPPESTNVLALASFDSDDPFLVVLKEVSLIIWLCLQYG